MNLWKRASLFLIRNKNKTVVLFLLLTVIFTLVLTGLSLGNAIKKAEKDLRKSLGGYFTVKSNAEQGYKEPVSESLVRDVGSLEGIIAYNGLDMAYMYAQDFHLLAGRFTTEGDEKAKLTQVLGNTDSMRNEFFVLGSMSLTKGRHVQPEDIDKAVISEELAASNNLTIGERISFKPNTDGMTQEQLALVTGRELEIVGLYQSKERNDSDSLLAECDMPENFVFTDTSFVRSIQEQVVERNIKEYSLGAAFFVRDAGELERIAEGVKDLSAYDWDGYLISKNNKAYHDLATPLIRMTGLLTAIIGGIIVLSAIVLALMFTMWMRDRLHETGIMLSIGKSKGEIFGQYILENSIIALLALLLSIMITFMAAEPMGRWIADVKTRVGLLEVLAVLGLGYLIVIISTGVASIRVFRMHPKVILSEIE